MCCSLPRFLPCLFTFGRLCQLVDNFCFVLHRAAQIQWCGTLPQHLNCAWPVSSFIFFSPSPSFPYNSQHLLFYQDILWEWKSVRSLCPVRLFTTPWTAAQLGRKLQWEKTVRWTRRTSNFHGSWFIIFKCSHKISHYYHNLIYFRKDSNDPKISHYYYNLIYFRKDSNDPVDQNSLNLKYWWHIFHIKQFIYFRKDSNDPVDQNSLNLKYRWRIFHIRQFLHIRREIVKIIMSRIINSYDTFNPRHSEQYHENNFFLLIIQYYFSI